MNTVPKKCYDTVREQRDKAEVKIFQLVTVIENELWTYLPKDKADWLTNELKKIGV